MSNPPVTYDDPVGDQVSSSGANIQGVSGSGANIGAAGSGTYKGVAGGSANPGVGGSAGKGDTAHSDAGTAVAGSGGQGDVALRDAGTAVADGGGSVEVVDGGVIDVPDGGGSMMVSDGGGSVTVAGSGGSMAAAGSGAGTGGSGGSGVAMASYSVSFSVTTAAPGGIYQPKNIGAIWIESPTGVFVKTLELWAKTRRHYLTKYNATVGTTGVVDVTASATLSYHIAHHVSWDHHDRSGALVAPGAYRVCVELTDSDVTGPNYCLPFDTSAGAQSLTPMDQRCFKSLDLTVQ